MFIKDHGFFVLFFTLSKNSTSTVGMGSVTALMKLLIASYLHAPKYDRSRQHLNDIVGTVRVCTVKAICVVCGIRTGALTDLG